MYDRKTLEKLVDSYLIYSKGHPTRKGLSIWLEISSTTISHVLSGMYKNGKEYTPKPHISRKINNTDFELIRNVFG